MKYVSIGFILSLVGIIVSLVFWDLHMIPVITSSIGVVFLVATLIFSGTLVSGDRIRANYATEPEEERKSRNKMFTNSLLLAIPNFIVSIVFSFLLNNG